MTNTPDLIKRLESAEGVLDTTTNEALFEIAHGRKRNISTFEQYEPSERLPDYGASIDAALTLGRGEAERRAILGAIYENWNDVYPLERCILFGCAHALKARIT